MKSKVRVIGLIWVCLLSCSAKPATEKCVTGKMDYAQVVAAQCETLVAWLNKDFGRQLAKSLLEKGGASWVDGFVRNLILANAANRGIATSDEAFRHLQTLGWKEIVKSQWGRDLIFQKDHERLESFVHFGQEAKMAYQNRLITQTELAAVLAQFIVNNQVFGDGNHRTGLMVLLSLMGPAEQTINLTHTHFEALKEALHYSLSENALDFVVYRERFGKGPPSATKRSVALDYWLERVRMPHGVLPLLANMTARSKIAAPVKK